MDARIAKRKSTKEVFTKRERPKKKGVLSASGINNYSKSNLGNLPLFFFGRENSSSLHFLRSHKTGRENVKCCTFPARLTF